jgi:hypothetical protein
VRRVPKRLQLLGEPEGPVAVGAGVAEMMSATVSRPRGISPWARQTMMVGRVLDRNDSPILVHADSYNTG